MENSNQKLPKMKAFQLIKEYYAKTGVCEALVTQSYPFNGKILFGLLILGLAFIFQLEYIFNDAKTFAEYTQSIYVCSFLILMFLSIIILISKRITLFEFMNDVDKIINTGM